MFKSSFILLVALCSSISIAQDRILFLGNSYTNNNNLPNVFEQLCAAGGKPVSVQSNTPGGYTLGAAPNAHTTNASSQQLIKQGDWSYVILQEQSQIPVIPYYRDLFFHPGVEELVDTILQYNACANPMLYMTWGRQNGGQQCGGNYCSPVFVDFFHYQDSLYTAYTKAANDNQIPVAPVGMSWAKVLTDTNIVLHAGDQSHPKYNGTYLAACTFFAMIFGESPEGISFSGNLSAQEAAYLQYVAAEVVFNSSDDWNRELVRFQVGFEYQIQDDSVVVFNNTSTIANAITYDWRFGDGATSTDESPTHIYSASGNYEVILTVHGPCGEMIFKDSITIDLPAVGGPSSVNQALSKQGISLHPNPSSNSMVWVKGYNGPVEILDLKGQVILNTQVSNGRINVSQLKKGVYFLKPTDLNSLEAIKILRQ